eukprot:802004-Rhodomonas_salina.1
MAAAMRDVKILDEANLAAIDSIPVCVHIVTYCPPKPVNLWANMRYLEIVGITLPELLAQVPILSSSSKLWSETARCSVCFRNDTRSDSDTAAVA